MGPVATTALFVATALAPSGVAAWHEPAFCKSLDCPQFSSVLANATEHFEVRDYQSAAWVSTNVTGASDSAYEDAVDTGFKRLFRYISGANAGSVKVKMAAPVQVRVVPGAGPTCNTTFRVSFFVPFADQADPPAPTDASVYVDKQPAARVATLSYPGYVRSFAEDIRPQLQRLLGLLQYHGLDGFDTNQYATAGYDSPFSLGKRHNEVWFFQKGE